MLLRALIMIASVMSFSLSAWSQDNMFAIEGQADRADAGSFYNIDFGKENLALRGYDPVAYFTMNDAVKGDSQIFVDRSDVEENAVVRFYFVSQKHKEMFLDNPGLYEPTYGGHCAWARFLGGYADGDPKQWAINKDKTRLHVFINSSVRIDWINQVKASLESTNTNSLEETADKSWFVETRDEGDTDIGETARGVSYPEGFYQNL